MISSENYFLKMSLEAGAPGVQPSMVVRGCRFHPGERYVRVWRLHLQRRNGLSAAGRAERTGDTLQYGRFVSVAEQFRECAAEPQSSGGL